MKVWLCLTHQRPHICTSARCRWGHGSQDLCWATGEHVGQVERFVDAEEDAKIAAEETQERDGEPGLYHFIKDMTEARINHEDERQERKRHHQERA